VAAALTERARACWPNLRTGFEQFALPSGRIAEVLRRAGAPATPEGIGVTAEFFARAVHEARFLRDRYTFLDLAGDAWQLALALS